MKIDFSKYSNMNICVAVSGGKDSMALLHCMSSHAEEYGIRVTALNCEHGLRGEQSKRDSLFVEEYCKTHNILLKRYSADCNALAKESGQSVETAARNWRRECYADAAYIFNAVIATAHHMNDNAETVLFNLARGSGLSGVTGISDGEGGAYHKLPSVTELSGETTKMGYTHTFGIIRPLIECSRKEIETYIEQNNVPYVDDESNLTDDYTRNYIRHNVLPELEKAVPGATEAIYRFSRLAAEDERYLVHKALEYLFVGGNGNDALIEHCEEKPLFSRAVLAAVAGVMFQRKDYTAAHIESLYNLQFLEVGKTFEFLGLIAYKEEGRIAICEKRKKIEKAIPFPECCEKPVNFGVLFEIRRYKPNDEKLYLYCDLDKIPEGAVIRTRRRGDKFTKFGGGTKSLGDFMTDRKIPKRMRDFLPVIAVGNEVYAVIGVEISDKIRADENTVNKFTIACTWR